MTCTVTLSDSSFAAITSGKIEIEAFDPPSRLIDKKTNAGLSGVSKPPGAHGAVLGVTATDIFDVIVHTKGTSYAPPVLETFTGHGSSQLDVVLFSTTGATGSGTSGPAPASPTAVNRFILSQTWEIEAKRAILTVIATVRYLRQLPQMALPRFSADLEELRRVLRDLRIDPDLIE